MRTARACCIALALMLGASAAHGQKNTCTFYGEWACPSSESLLDRPARELIANDERWRNDVE